MGPYRACLASLIPFPNSALTEYLVQFYANCLETFRIFDRRTDRVTYNTKGGGFVRHAMSFTDSSLLARILDPNVVQELGLPDDIVALISARVADMNGDVEMEE